MFSDSEHRFGAFAGVVALVLVLALTAMAFTALDLEPGASRDARWEIAMPEPILVPSLGS